MKQVHIDFWKRLTAIFLSLLLLSVFVQPGRSVRAEEMAAENEFERGLNAYQKILEDAPLALGQEIALSVKLGEGLKIPEETKSILQDLRVTFRTMMDGRDSENGKLDIAINLKRQSAGNEGIDLKLYNVGKEIVVEAPALLDKALLLNEKAMANFTGKTQSFGELMPNYLFKQRDNMLQLISVLREIETSALAHFSEAAALAETFTVRDLSEELQVEARDIAAEETPAMLTEALQKLKDLPAAEALFKSATITDQTGEVAQSFAEAVQKAIDRIQDEPEKFQKAINLANIKDAEGNSRGFRLTVLDGEKPVRMELVRLAQGTEKALRFSAAKDDEPAAAFDVRYAENEEGLASGDFLLAKGEEEPVEGNFENLKFYLEEGGSWNMEGKLNLRVDLSSGAKMPVMNKDVKPEDETAENAEEGETEAVPAETSASRMLISLDAHSENGRHFYDIKVVPDEKLESQSILLQVESMIVPADQLQFADSLPAETLDLGDSESMSNLLSDSDFMNKLMNAFSYLGLDKLGF